jgi:hypothetical protein
MLQRIEKKRKLFNVADFLRRGDPIVPHLRIGTYDRLPKPLLAQRASRE